MVGAIVLAPVGLWTAAHPLGTSFGDAEASVASLANLTGLAGTAAFAVNLVIGSRLPRLPSVFGGLEAMYGVHKRLGAYALALVTAHAVLATAAAGSDSAREAARLYLPSAGWAVFAGAVAFAAMSAALALTFSGRLPHEAFVYVQKALGITFAVAAVHVLGVPGTRGSTPLAVFMTVLIATALAAFVYRSVLGRLLLRRTRYAVGSVNHLDEAVVEIRLDPLAKPISFVPGQFVFASFRAAAVGGEAHPFSIASPRDAANLTIVVKALGDYTTALLGLGAGAVASIEGPYGAFSYLNADNRRQIWIAGGIGVTPFLSMARSIDASAYEIDFYYCTEGVEHAYFLDEFLAIGDREPRFRVIPVRKRSLGRISAEDIVGASREIEHKAILICGPPAMLDNLATQFTAIGVPRDRLYFEDFSFLSGRRVRRMPTSV